LLGVDPQARRALDYYPTPTWMTKALLAREPHINDVLEPCAGDGAIERVLRADGRTVWTNDIDESRTVDSHHDITRPETWGAFDLTLWHWCVTNLPFNVADLVVPLAHARKPWIGGLAFLLRLSWLEPTDARQLFLEKHPPRRIHVLPRHDFRGNGQTDSVTSAWLVWDDNQASRSGISIVTKGERDRYIAEERQQRS
jgi:hypothetical protein